MAAIFPSPSMMPDTGGRFIEIREKAFSRTGDPIPYAVQRIWFCDVQLPDGRWHSFVLYDAGLIRRIKARCVYHGRSLYQFKPRRGAQ